jgi:hypothetical protein
MTMIVAYNEFKLVEMMMVMTMKNKNTGKVNVYTKVIKLI